MKIFACIMSASLLNAAEIPLEPNDEALALALAFEEGGDLEPSSKALPFISEPQDIEKISLVAEGLRKVFVSHGNVHAGDQFVPQHIPAILTIAKKLVSQCDSDINSLSGKNLVQVSESLILMTTLYDYVLDGYCYEKTPKTLSDIQGIITAQFLRSSREVGSYASGQGTQVWAVTIALALNLLNDPSVKDEVKYTLIHHLVDQSIEGMITQGGCIQGFVNRGFIALMNILSYYL
jgi:hypothetical protein